MHDKPLPRGFSRELQHEDGPAGTRLANLSREATGYLRGAVA